MQRPYPIRPFPSSLVPLFKKKSKCENELRVQVHFHANQAHCYRTDFTLRLDLKQRHKGLANGLLTPK